MKAHARDLVKETVTLSNASGHPVEVYPFVYSISSESGKEEFLDPSKADINTSLSNWIEISRSSIFIQPRKQVSVDIPVNINLSAKHGIYHARIVCAEGATRDEAEKRVHSSASVTINLDVLEDIRERVQLLRFVPQRTFFFGLPVTFLYTLENIGNRTAIPHGKIRIYSRQGKEVATIALNDEETAITSESKNEFITTWSKNPDASWFASTFFGGVIPGRYKAMLDITYGVDDQKTLQDSVIFWVVPLRALALMIIVLLFAMMMVSQAHRYFARR